MKKILLFILSFLLITPAMSGCKKKSTPEMVDMDIINTDGSHDDKYIFHKQIDKEESRKKKYKKKEF